MSGTLSVGDEWSHHYRGYRLQANPDGEVWWQVYQGTDRLFLDPTPEDLLENLLSVKRLGGRVRVTEGNDVVTRVEDDDDYRDVYVGDYSPTGRLVPGDESEYAVDVRPDGLSGGDLWPTVYDGAKYSFVGDQIWWQNPETGKRHPVETPIPSGVRGTLSRLKPRGGSFRVTPWNDVITLVENPPNPETVREQLGALPRVIKNVILLRRERGVEMFPVYVGTLKDVPLEVTEPPSLTDPLTSEERAELDSWAGSLGPTSETDPNEHTASGPGVRADDPEDW